MSDTPIPASSTEKTIVVDSRQLCRIWTFTYISIGLNVLILALLFIGCIIRHHDRHDRHHGFGGRGGGDGQCAMQWGGRGQSPGFHQFGGMGMQQGWGKPGGFGGRHGRMGMGPGMMGGMPGMDPDSIGGPGMGHGGFGMHGMMGGPGVGPVDPTLMTETLLNHLSTQLSLTDDQKAKMKPILQDQVTQMQKDMEARRLAMEKAMDETKTKLKSILNADQQKKLEAIPLPGQKPPTAAAPAGK